MTKKIYDPYNLTRRRFLQMSGLAAGGLVLAACGDSGTAVATTEAAPAAAPTTEAAAGVATTEAMAVETTEAAMAVPMTTLTTVNFDFNTPNINLQAPFLIGQQKGWFQEVGIENLSVTGLDDYLPPMFAGDIDIALMDAVIIFPAEDAAVEAGTPNGLKWISCNLGAQPLVMIANAGISAGDLAGKTIGGARVGSTNEALAKFMLGELGYDWENDVTFVNLTGGSNDWVTAMLSGQVDATIAFSRHIALAEEEGGSAIFTGSRPDPQAGFGMLQSKIDEFPDFPAAWNYAYIKAQRWCKDPANWEEMREIIAGEMGIDYPDNTFAAMELDAGIMTQDLGWSPDDMDTLMEFSRPFGEYRENLPWRDYTDVSGLHVAQEMHGLPTNPSADLTTGNTDVSNF